MFNKRALHWVVSEIYDPLVHFSQGTIAEALNAAAKMNAIYTF